MALIIGCRSGTMPTTFLGLPIGINMRSRKPWKILIEKFKKRMRNWKVKTLSFGGRHTLVCNVLGSLGTFMFSLYKAPSGIIKVLEGLRRHFFWGGDNQKRRIPWVKWEAVIAAKEKGGLGIG